MKKIVSIILAVVLVLQAFSFTAFAGIKTQTGYLNGFSKKPVYTAIGDSTAVGFHFELMENYKFDKISHYIHGAGYINYPQLVAKKMGFKLNNVAINGIYSDGLAEALTNRNAKLDTQSYFVACEYPNEGNLYWDAVKEADYISLNIGSNDLLKTDLSRNFMVIAGEMMLAKEGVHKLDASFVKQVLSFFMDSYFGDTHSKVIAEYKENYKTIFNSVRKMNPDAKLILVGCYNPFSKENLKTRIKDAIKTGKIWVELGGDISAFKTLIKSLIDEADAFDRAELDGELSEEISELTKAGSVGIAGTDGIDLADLDLSNININDVEDLEFLYDNSPQTVLLNKLLYTVVVALLGDRVQDFIDRANEVVKGYAEKYADDGVVYVDVPECTVPMKVLDMHPDDNGHKYIAKQICNTIKNDVDFTVWDYLKNRNFNLKYLPYYYINRYSIKR